MNTDTTERILTGGEKMMGVTFNPSGNELVNEIKQKCAELWDLYDRERKNTDNPDKRRFYALAQTNLEDSQMRAVKAVTWQY